MFLAIKVLLLNNIFIFTVILIAVFQFETKTPGFCPCAIEVMSRSLWNSYINRIMVSNSLFQANLSFRINSVLIRIKLPNPQIKYKKNYIHYTNILLYQILTACNTDTKFDFKNFTPATIFNVLKTFLGKLPTPLMTFELHELFTSASCKIRSLKLSVTLKNCLPFLAISNH